MTPAVLTELPCSTIVARAVEPDQLTNSVPIGVRKSAFIPRMNGKDNDGLSIRQVFPGALEFLRQKLSAPLKQAVTLHVGRAREISAGGYVLRVDSDPRDDDPHHALIRGFPARHAAESREEKAAWNRLAELLAAQARCCLKS